MPRKTTRTIDVRGLANNEKIIGATVQLANGFYRIVDIERGMATMEKIPPPGIIVCACCQKPKMNCDCA